VQGFSESLSFGSPPKDRRISLRMAEWELHHKEKLYKREAKGAEAKENGKGSGQTESGLMKGGNMLIFEAQLDELSAPQSAPKVAKRCTDMLHTLCLGVYFRLGTEHAVYFVLCTLCIL
jgi:hypothetical protein